MKRKKLEFTITVSIYMLTAIVSALLAIAVLSVHGKLTTEFLQNQSLIKAIFPVVVSEGFMLFMTMYDGKYAFRKSSLAAYLARCFISTLLMAGIWAIILLIQKNEISQSRYYFVTTIIFHFVLLTAVFGLVQKYFTDTYYKTHNASLVLLVADRSLAAGACELIKSDWSRKISAIALLEAFGVTDGSVNLREGMQTQSQAEAYGAYATGGVTQAQTQTAQQGAESPAESGTSSQAEEIDHVPVVAGKYGLIPWVRQHAVDEVFFFANDISSQDVVSAVQAFVKMGISVHLNLPTATGLNAAVKAADAAYYPYIVKELSLFMDKAPMLSYTPPQYKMRYLIIKRLMDMAGGVVGSVIAALLYIILGPIIKLDSPGPVLFAQERVGKNGRLFKIYKFRSMYIDAEARKAALMQENEMSGPMFKMKEDPRITRVGKFIRKTSLDEFPQFFNVLKGDMSLVGTRPPTVEEFKQYADYQKRRLSRKPGITGMWQVSGRSEIKDFEDVVRLDCAYIDNWSLRLDIEILLKTVMIVFTGRGSE